MSEQNWIYFIDYQSSSFLSFRLKHTLGSFFGYLIKFYVNAQNYFVVMLKWRQLAGGSLNLEINFLRKNYFRYFHDPRLAFL